MKPLFTGGGGAGMELFARCYPDASFADADPAASTNTLPLSLIPKATDPGFLSVLRHLMDHHTLLVPGVDEELPVLETLRREGVDILMPTQRYVTVMLDKFASMRWLAELGIPVPRTTIVKPRQGRGSEGVLVEQERLEGTEYTVTMSASQTGILRAIVPVRIIAKRRVTLHGVTEAHPVVMAACARIHDVCPAHGVVNIQGMLTEDRGFLPFEINPRISTTTALAVLAGVDVLANWYNVGDRYDPTPPLQPFREGLTLRRTWLNTVT